MAIPSYGIADLKSAFAALEIGAGRAMVVHSSLMHLGRLDGASPADIPARITDAMLEVIGGEGTVAVPASNWDYGAKGIPFDLQSTPAAKDLGVLSNHFLGREGVRRSANPTFSLALLGAKAEWLCGGGNIHPFGYDGAWDRLFQLNAEIVFLGASFDYLSFARYMESRFAVPYLYNKLFSTPVIDHGRPIAQPVTSLLRYRGVPVHYDLSRLERLLSEQGALRETNLGGGKMMAVRMDRCFALGMECLKRDIHFFLAERPAYVPDQLPVI